jgi:hypothetical protein
VELYSVLRWAYGEAMELLFVLLATLTLGPAANGHTYSVKPQMARRFTVRLHVR